ncbi:expressed unknown protein [Seminavis robusta]|uniref:Uncharacterized protein n=1 Tax=Seminavis robusta TaxID=568900 RepID=A0A9N8EEF5_9STRA|nr:expressed unknown protein [Seminavis robusta]|eukprot:Sro957_g224540.1 n/a (816) ;mRNA; f:23541-25988
MEQDEDPMMAFQEGVTEIMMACEELRQPFKAENPKVPTAVVVQGRDDLNLMFENLGGMHHQLHQNNNNANAGSNPEDEQIQKDLFQHCQLRVAQVAQLVLERAMASAEPQEEEDSSKRNNNADDDDDEQAAQAAQQQLELERQDFQASIARIAELNFIWCLETGQEERIAQIVEQYAASQRNALRERAKPSIARLVQERRNNNDLVMEKLPHSHVITVILGQASALIHPLLTWLCSLPPPPEAGQLVNKLVEAIRSLCEQSVQVLDEQAQTLVKTVTGWFWTDRNVDDWMAKSNSQEGLGSDSNNNKLYLGTLDGLVEEMAFSCQVLARYQALIQSVPLAVVQKTIEHEISPEFQWKYATLERFLATQQWKSALMLATPVSIVLGTSIQVPSVVEDAQYLSTRALERAASTRSTQAIGTVAHAISSHVWSTDITGGVHQALADQVGCYVDGTASATEQQQASQQQSPPRSNTNSFASALLGALDEDIGNKKTPPSSQPPSSGGAPSSGGLFQSLVGGGDGLQQIRINTDFCNLNGIHSASTACRSLVKFLDGLLENPEANNEEGGDPAASLKQMNAMIELAREELSHYGNAYDAMLKLKTQHVIQQWCGSLQDPPKRKNCPCIPLLRYYFLNENFELDQASFKAAESDSRLEQDLLSALSESKFLQQSHDKSDAEVLTGIREELTQIIEELILDCLLHAEPPKRFTDWGSLLLSKQVRMLKLYLAKLQDKNNTSGAAESRNPAATTKYRPWERLSQIVTVLQLERPSDWTLYQSTSVLTPQDVRTAMQLRVDFSAEAIKTVVAAMSTNGANGQHK